MLFTSLVTEVQQLWLKLDVHQRNQLKVFVNIKDTVYSVSTDIKQTFEAVLLTTNIAAHPVSLDDFHNFLLDLEHKAFEEDSDDRTEVFLSHNSDLYTIHHVTLVDDKIYLDLQPLQYLEVSIDSVKDLIKE